MKAQFFIKNLSLFLVPLLIPVLLLGTLAILITRQNVQSEWSWNQLALLGGIERSMEQALHEMDALYVSLMHEDTLYRLEDMLQTQKLTLENLRLLRTFQSFMNGPTDSKPYLDSIYVYVNNGYDQFLASGAGLSSLRTFHDTAWKNSYDTHLQETGMWTENRFLRRYKFEAAYPVTSLYRNLKPMIRSKPSGVIVLNINADYMSKLLDEMKTSAGQLLYVLDEKGRILFQSSNAVDSMLPVSQIPWDGEATKWTAPSGERFGVSQSESSVKWRYISLVPQELIERIPSKLSAYTISLVLLSLILGVGLTGLLTWRNVNHIRKIITIIQHAEQGLSLHAEPAKAGDEYGYITQKVLSTFIERHYLTTQLSEKKYKLQVAELLALQAQINPHFLYNTLEIINWRVIALTGGPNEASRMLGHLAKLLKYAMTAPGQGVCLREEIANTQHYISLQEIRHPGGLHVAWQIEPYVESLGCIRLLLQPLVENALLHGYSGRNTTARLKIRIRRAGKDMLSIVVIDNGVGMSKSRLAEVRASMEQEDAYEHIGLANTYRRLRLSYPSVGQLVLKSKQGLGTVVTVYMPVVVFE